MKRNLLPGLMLLSGLIAFSYTASAGQWFVNDGSVTGDVFTSSTGSDANPGTAALPFATIQFAINSAASGDTIYVDAGTYNEAIIDISKSLLIRGAKYGIPAGPSATPLNRGTNEAFVNGGFYYGQSLDNISVDGFYINIGTNARGIQSRGLNSVIINNIVTGTVNPLIQQIGIATRANGPLRLHSYMIRNNHVTSLRYGVYFDGNLENPSEVSYNYVSGCLTAGYVLTGSNGHLYRGNVSDNNNQGMLITKGNLSILENTIRNNAVFGIRLSGTASTFNNLIQNNFIQNNTVGIGLTDPDPGATNNQAHFNSFTGNSVNIDNAHADLFNATCNWYGTADQPTIASSINGSVTYIPYLTDGTDSDPSTDGFQPTTTCVVPVVLLTFGGQAKDAGIILNWQTSAETNSSHFIVERSTDNTSFAETGRISAAGFSNDTRNYRFTDQKAPFDIPVYYRLRMVDLDGTYKFSRIIRLILNNKGELLQRIFPNPVTGGKTLQADIVSGYDQPIKLSLVSLSGQTVHQFSFQLVKGTNRLILPVPAGLKGMYFLVGRNGTELLFRTPVRID